MKIYIIGMGMGDPELLTGKARAAIVKSTLIIGAQRVLDCIPEGAERRFYSIDPTEIAGILRIYRDRAGFVSVIVSGDVGFYSLAKALSERLTGEDVEYVSGIGSLQYLSAALGVSWDDAAVESLHGRDQKQSLLGKVMSSHKTFVLTGGQNTVRSVCEYLCDCGLGGLSVAVGENLSYESEEITRDSANALVGRDFSALSVMMIFNPTDVPSPVTHGLADGAFDRGDVPMTKAEVRAVVIAKLALRRGQTVWDVGAGTGSVSVETARVLRDGAVYAVERDPDAVALLRQNREKHGVFNLCVIEGEAPGALSELPAPDAVFIGGSGGTLEAVVAAAIEKNPSARIVVTAIMLETVSAALAAFKKFELRDCETVLISVAKAREAGAGHMMIGQNPVYILSAGGIFDGNA